MHAPQLPEQKRLEDLPQLARRDREDESAEKDAHAVDERQADARRIVHQRVEG